MTMQKRLEESEALAYVLLEETKRRAQEPEKLSDEALANLTAAHLAALQIAAISIAWRKQEPKDGGR